MAKRGRGRGVHNKQVNLPVADDPVVNARAKCRCGTGRYCHRHRAYRMDLTDGERQTLHQYARRVRMPPMGGRPFGYTE